MRAEECRSQQDARRMARRHGHRVFRSSRMKRCREFQVGNRRLPGPRVVDRARRPALYIGTSGWSYRHWKGPFYPSGLPTDEYLSFYAQRFSSVEINNTFYRLPDKKILLRWRDAVPASFLFSVKVSRYITHVKRLANPAQSLKRFLRVVALLGPSLGPVLFQLPPNLEFDERRLASVLMRLGRAPLAAFEFRDSTWFRDETYELLTEYGAAFCIYDLAGRQSPQCVTTDFAYVRLHGPDAPYRGRYSAASLRRWAETFSSWLRQGKSVYCYFDNDERGYAVMDALRLRRMMRSYHLRPTGYGRQSTGEEG